MINMIRRAFRYFLAHRITRLPNLIDCMSR